MRGSGRTWLLGLVGLLLIEQALFRLWPLVDDNDAPPGLELQLGVAAPILLLLLPHIVAFLGRTRRWLLPVAGSLGIVVTILSLAGFTLIFFTVPLLLVPSIVYLMRGAGAPRSIPSTASLVVALALLSVAAAGVLFLTEDPRCTILVRRGGELVYEVPDTCDPSSSGRLGPEIIEWSATSDTIALHESALSLLLSGAAIALCARSRAKEDGLRLEASA